MTEAEKQAIRIQRILDHAAMKLPCCHFGEFDCLIVSGTITSCNPPAYVRHMHVVASTVYHVHGDVHPDDSDAAQRLMMFKVWCEDDDPQLPSDGDTRLWFDFSAADTEVAVLVKKAERDPNRPPDVETI